ncbi:sugar-phosphatase [Curtobacterium sp. PhB142]|uniref:HAD-IA family hydrolase n=1 Tax=unclassified Curtobacterium TaxID=257496 RepID=UPI000F4A51CE|nr:MULTISPECIES: HAD-IA family hydrolase [unclassified Curtobacterium]ROS37393.1 sugar-phosphatase [Curtobacterium sp. PhB78]TCL86182.1 sugar-phosphatase [Curtobacterium sp. PhB142]TCM02372.1 sugar-phosphatase [Curtobacterium sp. PhB134]
MIDIVASGVLFDMDGTLVDSTAVVEATWTRFGHDRGIDPAEILAFSHGRQAISTIEHFLPELDRDEQLRIAAALVAEESASSEGIFEIPGAAAFVDRLLDAGVPVALVTSAPRDLAAGRMAAAGLTMPTAFVPSEDVEHGKPHPDGYLRGAALLGVEATDCVAFEDAPAGLESAIASGATTVVVGPHESDVTAGLYRVSGYEGITVEPEGSAFRIRG